jgi:hypothetical protein
MYAGMGNKTKYLPEQLYHDLQAMVKTAVFCVPRQVPVMLS